jgi:hypothetical protein
VIKLLRIFSIGRALTGLITKRLGLTTCLNEERLWHQSNASAPSLGLSFGYVVQTLTKCHSDRDHLESHLKLTQKTHLDASVFSCFLHKIRCNLIYIILSGWREFALEFASTLDESLVYGTRCLTLNASEVLMWLGSFK